MNQKTNSGIFPKTELNDLIIDKLKEIMLLQNSIKLDDMQFKKKRGKPYNFS